MTSAYYYTDTSEIKSLEKNIIKSIFINIYYLTLVVPTFLTFLISYFTFTRILSIISQLRLYGQH